MNADAFKVFEDLAQKNKKKKEDYSNGHAPIEKYTVENGCIIFNKRTNDGIVPTPLCNFHAWISSQQTEDDGAQKKTVFVVEGKLFDGTSLPAVQVPANNYSGLNWVTANWGSKAIVYAGFTNKDHLRAAIQLLSQNTLTRHLYAHTGFRKINGKWLYLHSGGAIGEIGLTKDVEVSLGDYRLSKYFLPSPPSGEDLKQAIHASLSFLELAPLKVTYPILCGVYGAPLCEILAIDWSIFLVGPTGSFKTELTSMAQAHFGSEFNRKNLPASWTATENALEYIAFKTKDAIITIDDFKPGGTSSDIAKLHNKADRVLRSQGNRNGRDRMDGDCGLRPQFHPRGIILASGEDIPYGHSLRARMAILEVSPNEVDTEKLTAIQNQAAQGLLSDAMSAYLKWLAPKIDSLRESLLRRQREIRSELTKSGLHRRTPEMTSMMVVAWETFLDFAHESGTINLEERERYCQSCILALSEISQDQAEHQDQEESAARFFELISAALISGRAHCVDSKTGQAPQNPNHWGWKAKGPVLVAGTTESPIYEWQASGEKIGWVDGNRLLLDPNVAYGMAQKMARDQNTSLPVTMHVLLKRLVQRNLIIPESNEKPGKRKNTRRETIEGQRKRVMVIPDKYSVHSLREKGPMGPVELPHNENKDLGHQIQDTFFEGSQFEVHQMGPNPRSNQGSVTTGPIAPLLEEEGTQINSSPDDEIEVTL